MRDVKNKMFGPGEDVLLDRTRFVNCTFQGCNLHYAGLAVKFKDCHFDRCNLIVGGSVGIIVETLRFLGFNLVAVGTSGNNLLN